MNRMRLRRIAETSYPAVQLAMAPHYRGLRDAEIEAILEERFSGASPEDVENFMKTLQKIGKVAAPIAQKALPGVIQGASTGMVAGPWGALAGGLAGGAASLLAGGGPKAQRTGAAAPVAPSPVSAPPAPAVSPVPSPAPTAMPPARPAPAVAMAQVPMRPPGRQDPAVEAAARLILLLSRPQVQQALLALLLGEVGRRNIPVQGRQVPVESFADALAELSADLAERAMTEPPPASGTADDWTTGADGAPLIDASNPTERATLLFGNLITDTTPPLRTMRPLPVEFVDEIEEEDVDDHEDALEAYETWMEEA